MSTRWSVAAGELFVRTMMRSHPNVDAAAARLARARPSRRRPWIMLATLVAISAQCGGDPNAPLALVDGSLRVLHSEKPALAECGSWAFDVAVDFVGSLEGALYRYLWQFGGGGPAQSFRGERQLDATEIRVEGNTIHFEVCAPNTSWRAFSAAVVLVTGRGAVTNEVSGGTGSPHYGEGP